MSGAAEASLTTRARLIGDWFAYPASPQIAMRAMRDVDDERRRRELEIVHPRGELELLDLGRVLAALVFGRAARQHLAQLMQRQAQLGQAQRSGGQRRLRRRTAILARLRPHRRVRPPGGGLGDSHPHRAQQHTADGQRGAREHRCVVGDDQVGRHVGDQLARSAARTAQAQRVPLAGRVDLQVGSEADDQNLIVGQTLRRTTRGCEDPVGVFAVGDGGRMLFEAEAVALGLERADARPALAPETDLAVRVREEQASGRATRQHVVDRRGRTVARQARDLNVVHREDESAGRAVFGDRHDGRGHLRDRCARTALRLRHHRAEQARSPELGDRLGREAGVAVDVVGPLTGDFFAYSPRLRDQIRTPHSATIVMAQVRGLPSGSPARSISVEMDDDAAKWTKSRGVS